VVMLGGIVVLPVMDATIVSLLVVAVVVVVGLLVFSTLVYPVIVVVFIVAAEDVIVVATATLGMVVIKTMVILVVSTVFIVAAILVLFVIASVAALDVTVVFNVYGPELSVLEAKDVTTAIFVGVALLVCTVLNFAVLYIVVLVAVDVMIMPAVSDLLVVVTDALCVKGMILLLISNVMGDIFGAKEVVVASVVDMLGI
jgi:hypothetical protein